VTDRVLDSVSPEPADLPASQLVVRAPMARLAILNIVGAASVLALWVNGILLPLFQQDETRISWALLLVTLIGIVCAFLGRWADVRWIANSLALLGMIATIYGFILLGQAVKGSGSASADAVRQMIILGIPNGLTGTLVGFMGYMWLRLLAYLCHGEDV